LKKVAKTVNRVAKKKCMFALVADSSSAGYNSLDHNQEIQSLIVDCGATTTLTTTLMNMSNAIERVIDILLAGKGSILRSSHIGDKTYHVLDHRM
jgi:hypothetical protein